MKILSRKNKPNIMWRLNTLIMLALFLLSFTTSYSQLGIIGNTSVCIGSMETYTIDNPDAGAVYNWTTSSTQAVYIPDVNNGAIMQWLEAGIFTLTIQDPLIPANTVSITVAVYENSEPYITYDVEVGCQEMDKEHDIYGNQMVTNQDGCVNVCELSTVNYTVHNTSSWQGNLGHYTWVVDGGEITHTNGTLLPTAATSVSGQANSGDFSDIRVNWFTAGTGSISVTVETPNSACLPKTTSLCVTIIESPIANFLFDNLLYLEGDDCYKVCKNQLVSFNDLSTSSPDSPILFWEWNFDDLTTNSTLQNPQHAFAEPGTYTVSLTVTNDCNCSHTFVRKICVSELLAPVIECPSVQCENSTAVYTTTTICDPFYTWEVAGGSIIAQTDQPVPSVTIEWNNIGSDGYGYLGLNPMDCQNVCPTTAMVRIPVVLQTAEIEGATMVCVGSNYIYNLPAWPATNYKWKILNNNTGASFNSSAENGHWIDINPGSSEGTFELQCVYTNTISTPSCGGTTLIHLVNVTPQPEITAPEELCIQSACTCEVAGITAPSVNILWTLTKPDLTTVTQTTAVGETEVVFNPNEFAVAGTYLVDASDPAAFCDPAQISIDVIDPPEAPTAIIGEDVVCLGYPYSYTTSTTEPNTITSWEIIGGAISGSTNLTSASGNSITVIWNDLGAKSISVSRAWEQLPECAYTGISKIIDHIVVSGDILPYIQLDPFIPAPAADPCEDETYNYYASLDNNVIGETFNWSIDAGSLTVGSISAGQGTNACSVTWLYLGALTPCTLKCEVTKCGVTTTIEYPLTIEPNAIVTNLQGDGPVCEGESIVFTPVVSGGIESGFKWDFGNGNIILSTASNYPYTFDVIGDNSFTFNVSVSAKSQCSDEYSAPFIKQVTINPNPQAGLSPSNPFVYCPPNDPFYPQEMTITNSGSSTYSYAWMFDDLAGNVFQINNASGISHTAYNSYPNSSPATGSPDGQYYCIVTNTTTGCATESVHKTVNEVCSPGCTPLGTADIINPSVTLVGCGQLKATCTTLGSPIDYIWVVSGADPSTYTANGLGNYSESPIYTFTQPGEYVITLHAYYTNSIPGGDPCVVAKGTTGLVPYIADIDYGLTCNQYGNGYELTLINNSSIYPGLSGITTTMFDAPAPYFTDVAVIEHAAAGVHTIGIALQGYTHDCIVWNTVDVPEFPLANFLMETTYAGNPSYPSKSCEKREIEFTEAVMSMSNIGSYVWNFGDNTSSNMVNPLKEYDENGDIFHFPELTITDDYGCTSTITKDLMIYDNDLSFDDFLAYDKMDDEYCLGTVPNIAPQTSLGQFPFTYQWYQGIEILPNSTGSVYSEIPTTSGAYWVEMTDDHNCITAINPSPANVSVIYAPTAIIEGKHDVCKNEFSELEAMIGQEDGPQITYEWKVNGTVSTFTDKKITIPYTIAGTYVYELTVSSTNNPCSQTSGPFSVTVHANPPVPQIIQPINVIDCTTYELELLAISGVMPQPQFNWSNGTATASNIVHHGGAYRVSITDQYGCTSYKDIDVPRAPNYYFWRFPTGCYSFCPRELPKQVDGPMYVNFEEWNWLYYGAQVTQNGSYQGSGFNSPSDPLVIDLAPNGEGEGVYSWILDNGLCLQESDMMEWEEKECCELQVTNVIVDCIGANEFSFSLEVDLSSCNDAPFNVAILNNLGTAVTATITINTPWPNFLSFGGNTIDGTFTLQPGLLPTLQNITFFVEAECETTCMGQLETRVPKCAFKGSDLWFTEERDSDVDHIAQLNIYPNPTTDQTWISYSFPESDTDEMHKRSIIITDALGRHIETIELHELSGMRSFNVNKLRQGLYFVEIKDNDLRLMTKRMIVYR